MEKNKTKKHYRSMGNAELCMKSKMQVCTELLKTPTISDTIRYLWSLRYVWKTNQITDWWKYNCIETAKTDWINMKRWHPWQPKMNHIRFASVVKDAERLREIVRGKKDRRRRRRLGGWIWISKSVSHMPHVTLLQSSPIFKWIIKKRGC